MEKLRGGIGIKGRRGGIEGRGWEYNRGLVWVKGCGGGMKRG